MDKIKKAAIKFKKSLNFKGKEITFKSLTLAIAEQGFLFRTYSESLTLLMSMGLYDESKQADSVSAVDKSHVPYIFISEDLEPQYSLFVLAHEIGHIVLEHRKTESLKRIQEREANLFALYFLSYKDKPNKKIKCAFIVESLVLCASLIATLTLTLYRPEVRTITTSTKVTQSESQNNNDICYYTRYGKVYHIYPDCQYLKNSSTVRSGTIYEANKDRLCSACQKRSKK